MFRDLKVIMILGYLDSNEKNIDVERQRQQILNYASENGLVAQVTLYAFLRQNPELKPQNVRGK